MTLTVIIGKDKVYGTFDQTICYTESFTDRETMEKAVTNAKSVCFDYGERQLNCMLCKHTDNRIKTNEDVFKYLERYK